MTQYPYIKFQVAPLGHFIHVANRFLNPEEGRWDWSRNILRKYPELEKKLAKVKDITKRKKIAQHFFEKFISKHKKEFGQRKRQFQREWNKINNKYMVALSGILEIKWPAKDKEIMAFITPNPICPRNISGRWFDTCILSSPEHMRGIAAHELLHFLYFEKWKKVYPKTPESHFNSPHLVWKLSEMVPKAILSDKKIQKIISHEPRVYHEYENLRIKGRPLLNYIGEFYNKRKDFEDFLQKSWAFVNKHKKEIDKA